MDLPGEVLAPPFCIGFANSKVNTGKPATKSILAAYTVYKNTIKERFYV